MDLKPWMIGTAVGICLLSAVVGLTMLLLSVLHLEGTDGLMKIGTLIAGLPLLCLLMLASQYHGGIRGGADVKLVSRTWRLLIWGVVVLLALGCVLVIVWVLRLERI